MRSRVNDSMIEASASDSLSASAAWEPLIASLDYPSQTLKFVACWLAALVAHRRDQRLMLVDIVYGIEPGTEGSFLSGHSLSYIAQVQAALLKDLSQAIGIVTEVADCRTAQQLRRVRRILSETMRGDEIEQIEQWIRVSWERGVEHRSFLEICS